MWRLSLPDERLMAEHLGIVELDDLSGLRDVEQDFTPLEMFEWASRKEVTDELLADPWESILDD